MPLAPIRRNLPPALLSCALLALALLCLGSTAQAQGRGPGGGGGGMGGPGGGMGGGPGIGGQGIGGSGIGGPGGLSPGPFGGSGGSFPQTQGTRNSPPPTASSSDRQSTMRGGLQLGPPGRWWDDSHFARSLGLDSKQQHRMDEVFGANKGNLLKLYKNLQHEESQLEKATRVKEPQEAQIFEQIDRVTAARGELEKANAHMLLEIRKEMTPQQIGRLEDHRSPE